MFKYMKYELRGTYKFMLTIILTVLGASTGLQLYALNTMNKFNNINDSVAVSSIPTLLVIILPLIIFGAFITALFYIIGSFRKELYEDRGYLTFSLPLTGKQILGAKLMMALIWSALLGLSSLIYNLVLAWALHGSKFLDGLEYIISFGINNAVITVGFASVFSSVVTLLLIYFAITLSRVSVRNKKIGGLWFIIFLILNSLVSYATLKAADIIPYYFDLNAFKIIGQNALSNSLNSSMVVNNNGMIINIGSLLLSIVVAIGTFLGTSYLIEKKIDI